jgi:hypothetical protein
MLSWFYAYPIVVPALSFLLVLSLLALILSCGHTTSDTAGNKGPPERFAVSSVPSTPYTRRALPDGTTVSFCNKCFDTVAESHWEAELDMAEQEHVCDPEHVPRVVESGGRRLG